MSEIQIKFPDGNVKSFESGVTTEDIAGSISPGLRRKLWPASSMVRW